MKIKVGVSARHAHLKEDTYIKLFGNNNIEKLRDLDQPGQYASTSTITIKKDDIEIKNVRVLGPFRNYNQVEISRTDAYKLKTNPPVRASGDIKQSESITLIGPKGKVKLDEGLILANRHIHIDKKTQKQLGLENIKTVSIKIEGEKGGILNNVTIKAQEPSSLRLHLDTDDANAFNLKNDDEVEIIKEGEIK